MARTYEYDLNLPSSSDARQRRGNLCSDDKSLLDQAKRYSHVFDLLEHPLFNSQIDGFWLAKTDEKSSHRMAWNLGGGAKHPPNSPFSSSGVLKRSFRILNRRMVGPTGGASH
jgi:hypothetical protein